MLRATPDSFARAKQFFEEAVALDPGYSEPHAELGQYYFLLGAYGLRPVGEAMPAARAQALRALELSAGESQARAVLCAVASAYDYDWQEAERQFSFVLAADPVPAAVYGRCAINYLVPVGRIPEALAYFEKILRQDPLNVPFRGTYAMILTFTDLHDRALIEAHKAVEIDGNQWFAYFSMTMSHLQRGNPVEACRFAEECVRAAPWNAIALGSLAGILARLGEANRAAELLTKLKRMAPTGLFLYHLMCSDIDTAANYYSNMIEQRDAAAT